MHTYKIDRPQSQCSFVELQKNEKTSIETIRLRFTPIFFLLEEHPYLKIY
jgi:hypothetical protein